MNRYTSGLGSKRSLPSKAETAQKGRNKTKKERKGRGSGLWSRHHQSAHVEKESVAVPASRPAKAVHAKREDKQP